MQPKIKEVKEKDHLGGETRTDFIDSKLEFWNKESESEVAYLYLTLCDPVDCSLPGSSIHGILQARVLEWVAISFSRGSSRTWVSHIAGRRFTI